MLVHGIIESDPTLYRAACIALPFNVVSCLGGWQVVKRQGIVCSGCGVQWYKDIIERQSYDVAELQQAAKVKPLIGPHHVVAIPLAQIM